ncbi:DHBP synthase RibB-like alpha/beta domain-containing protein [Lasiosphaeris hirsuta]|uniref:Threonylcarbamoyl-AMP synthase n=1 Tax=Lasiosphaeris hirsuta TaxID=260670 RepID=A0AA40BCK2_9PEZI|nr:DHBP synthase RibB-like alpha/beta domain-containing protein [Lasiosphaeris hirsuta]
MKTRILKVPLEGHQGEATALGRWAATSAEGTPDLNVWELPAASASTSSLMAPLHEAAARLRDSAVPVAFPTETVYGLGADATRSAAVKGIYTAKGRPSDNPLIVHVCDLEMLRSLLQPPNGTTTTSTTDPIPAIYQPLIAAFWPGPLTILLPLPTPSPLAPEVTAGLTTFGVRMPASALARTLIKLAGAPLAAPSANASTKPSPTTAAHVVDDLAGRIELVVDGGACAVGVESTVVDGLCAPPAVLRPGGVSMDALRAVAGWEAVERAYRDRADVGAEAPRAPGMKYKHYSPRARVILFEGGRGGGVAGTDVAEGTTVAVIRTGGWAVGVEGLGVALDHVRRPEVGESIGLTVREGRLLGGEGMPVARLLDVDLGRGIKGVAHGLFAALRELDRLGADVIFVEGVNDKEDIAAAVMNRLRKAASEIRG